MVFIFYFYIKDVLGIKMLHFSLRIMKIILQIKKMSIFLTHSGKSSVF